jgi:hypothetical protein
MKNTIKAALFAMIIMAGAVSCGTKPSENTSGDGQDTVQTDTVKIDTAQAPVDTTGAVQEQDTVSGK